MSMNIIKCQNAIIILITIMIFIYFVNVLMTWLSVSVWVSLCSMLIVIDYGNPNDHGDKFLVYIINNYIIIIIII